METILIFVIWKQAFVEIIYAYLTCYSWERRPTTSHYADR